jgi:hypothetical protein
MIAFTDDTVFEAITRYRAAFIELDEETVVDLRDGVDRTAVLPVVLDVDETLDRPFVRGVVAELAALGSTTAKVARLVQRLASHPRWNAETRRGVTYIVFDYFLLRHGRTLAGGWPLEPESFLRLVALPELELVARLEAELTPRPVAA